MVEERLNEDSEGQVSAQTVSIIIVCAGKAIIPP